MKSALRMAIKNARVIDKRVKSLTFRSRVCPHAGMAVIKAHHLAGSASLCGLVSVKEDFPLGFHVSHSSGSVWGSLSCPRGRRSTNLAPILETLVNGGTTIKSSPEPKVGIFRYCKATRSQAVKNGKENLGSLHSHELKIWGL